MSKTAINEAQALRAGLSMLEQAPSERRVEFIQTVMNRGLALYNSGEFDSADVLFDTVASDPLVRPKVLHIRGVIALQRGEDERALDLLEEAIQLNPADGEVHAALGVLLLRDRQHSQALAAYAAALTLQPDNAPAQLGVARALAALDLSDFAYDAFRDLLTRAPDHIEAIVDFGWLLSDMDRHDEGVTVLRDALARHPRRDELRTVLAVCLFGIGDWPAAWAEYEGRLADPRVSTRLLSTDRPRWQGENLTGKTILLQSEQGLGDVIQFVRYAPMVKARGGRVILGAAQALVPLLRTVDGIDDVIHDGGATPEFDVHAPLLSLPLLFETRTDTVPAAIPYLAPDAHLAAQWRERLANHTRNRSDHHLADQAGDRSISVGLVWQGNPAHLNDRRRSMQFDLLRPLLDCPGVHFVSLQIGPGREQLTEFDDRIIDPAADIDTSSFADVAAIIANLDLVISIDSALAHLAGAMGKPVWILLAKSNDWRWLREREDTPWYPQARLFRQTKPGDWAEVVTRLSAELWSFASAGAPLPADKIPDPLARSALRLGVRSRVSDPVICDALFVEASRQHRMGHLDRAKALFEHVLSLDPGHVNTLCNLGALELGMGHGERALARLQTAAVLAPKLAPVRMALADALLDAQKAEQALAQYQKAIEIAPTSVLVHVAYATALRRLGAAGQGPAGLESDAIKRTMHEHYRKALELAPNDDAVHAQYALALCELGDIDQAMMHFLAATKINQQQSAEFYEALGRACAARGNAQGAEISLRHALTLDEKRVTAHCALGEHYLTLARPDDAEASFRRALAIDAAHAMALRGYQQAQVSRGFAATSGKS